MVHIGLNDCKSKFLMCISLIELCWYIIAHLFYLFKREHVGKRHLCPLSNVCLFLDVIRSRQAIDPTTKIVT